MQVPRLGVKSEIQLLACAIVTATPDLSHICDLPHSSQQHQILYPLSEARDQTRNFMIPSQIRFHCATTGTPPSWLFHFKEFLRVPIRDQGNESD